jgi:hypothetical protein
MHLLPAAAGGPLLQSVLIAGSDADMAMRILDIDQVLQLVKVDLLTG